MTNPDLRCVRCLMPGHLSKDCKQPIPELPLVEWLHAVDAFWTTGNMEVCGPCMHHDDGNCDILHARRIPAGTCPGVDARAE